MSMRATVLIMGAITFFLLACGVVFLKHGPEIGMSAIATASAASSPEGSGTGIDRSAARAAVPAPPDLAIRIDGSLRRAEPLELVTTPTGKWPIYSLGDIAPEARGDTGTVVEPGRAYLFNLASNPGWWSLCLTAFGEDRAHESGYPKSLFQETLYSVEVNGSRAEVRVAPGSMKCIDNGDPVPPDPAQILTAVKAGRLLPYGEAAFKAPFKAREPAYKPQKLAEMGYDPARIYDKAAVYDKVFGNVSVSGGEAPSSRGFVSDTDAAMIVAALSDDNGLWNTATRDAATQIRYALGLPYLVIQSRNHDLLRDPQKPLPGDRKYRVAGREKGVDQYGAPFWQPPAGYPGASLLDLSGAKDFKHRRDLAHMFNHGYAWWLATGDPRVALLMQAQAAWAFASYYPAADKARYQPVNAGNVQERATLNHFAAMWRLRDVMRETETSGAGLFWDDARMERMIADSWTEYKAYIKRLESGSGPEAISVRSARLIDGGGYSNFMMQNYGPELAYLWAQAGEPVLLQRMTEHFVIRLGKTGGIAGLDPGKSDSSVTWKTDGGLGYRNADGLAAFWRGASNIENKPTDRFDNASLPYTIRAYWLMRMGQDAAARGWIQPVDGLDAAIVKVEADIRRTAKWKSVGTLMWKHAAVPFGTDGLPALEAGR